MIARLLNSLRRCRAEVAFHFDGEKVTIAKGRFPIAAASELAHALVDHSAGECEIHILPNGKVEFDQTVPATAQQPIRNVLAQFT